MIAIGNSHAGKDNLNKNISTLSKNLFEGAGISVDGGNTTDIVDYSSSCEVDNSTDSSWIVNTTSDNVVPNSAINVNPTNVTTLNKPPDESIVTSTYRYRLPRIIKLLIRLYKRVSETSVKDCIILLVQMLKKSYNHLIQYLGEYIIIICLMTYIIYKSIEYYSI